MSSRTSTVLARCGHVLWWIGLAGIWALAFLVGTFLVMFGELLGSVLDRTAGIIAFAFVPDPRLPERGFSFENLSSGTGLKQDIAVWSPLIQMAVVAGAATLAWFAIGRAVRNAFRRRILGSRHG